MVPDEGWPGFGWPSGPLGKSKGGSEKVFVKSYEIRREGNILILIY